MMKSQAAAEPLNLLLVEDNDAHAEMVKRSFEQHEIPNVIHHVDDGQKALDFIFHQGEYADSSRYPNPHCVLLDLRLPKVDGLEVLRLIKSDEVTRKTPVVILTTSSADKDIATSYDYHANSYVVKPMDFDRFEALMQDLGYYWLTWNRNPWR